MKNFSKKIIYSVIAILALLSVITGYYAFKLKEQYVNSDLNNYNESFSNVVEYVNKIENCLAKATISKSPNYSTETLTKIWDNSNLAMAYLSRIPVNNDELSKTVKFLNQVSDYCYTLSKKTMQNEELTTEELENLHELHKYSIELEGSLNQIEQDLNNGEFNWNDMNKKDIRFAQTVDNVSIFSNLDSNFQEYEGLIYDGAFSEHIEKVDKKGLTGDDISEDDAEKIARNFLTDEKIKNIERKGLMENANIPAYLFKFESDNLEGIIIISKKGGHIVQIDKNRNVFDKTIDAKQAKKVGEDFLRDKGFKNMYPTYYSIRENIITVNYAYKQDEVIVYPDLIKVKIALDNSEILGLETSGYLNSHEKREIVEPLISIDKARDRINPNLNILAEGMAIIPTKWKTEIQCYEFKGKVEEKEFLVYINCRTGKEEDILVVIDNENGEITM